MNTFLHVGCGRDRQQHTTAGFNDGSWQELRLDINPAVEPDVVGSMVDLSGVPSESVDAIYSSHSIEHLYAHEVGVALAEFLRVLTPEGFAVIACPDLQSICQLVAEDKLTDTAYQSPAGPVAPIDMIYGFRPRVAEGNHWMAHRSGFTRTVLRDTLNYYGFKRVSVMARGAAPYFDLWALASKSERDDATMLELMQKHFP